VTVIRKGSRAVQQLPASPDAFVWLRLYQSGLAGSVPLGRDDPLWVTAAPVPAVDVSRRAGDVFSRDRRAGRELDAA